MKEFEETKLSFPSAIRDRHNFNCVCKVNAYGY